MKDEAKRIVLNTKGPKTKKGTKSVKDGRTLFHVRQVLSEHPDWDDEEVAEEVLNIVD